MRNECRAARVRKTQLEKRMTHSLDAQRLSSAAPAPTRSEVAGVSSVGSNELLGSNLPGEASELHTALSQPSEQQRGVELQSAMQPEPSGATMNEAPRRTKPPRLPRTVRCSSVRADELDRSRDATAQVAAARATRSDAAPLRFRGNTSGLRYGSVLILILDLYSPTVELSRASTDAK